MDEVSRALAEGIEDALPRWVEASVERIAVAFFGRLDDDLRNAARQAGERAVAEIGALVRTVLDTDWDEQRTTPLTVLRTAVRYPTEVLRAAGVPPVVRDAEQEALFPDDDYDLTPARFADVDLALTDLGIAWGATKAKVMKERHG